MKNHIYILVFSLLSVGVSSGATDDNAVIYPEDTYGKTMEYLILDLKLNAGQVGSSTKADLFFKDYDMNGVRISVYGNEGHRYHPSAGTVLYDEAEKSGYYKLVKSVQRSQTARGDNDFMVFASKKLKGKTTFPDWVLDGDGPEIKTDEYITLLYDFVSFMYQKGIEIDIMGVDNEERFNYADMTPSQYKDIVDGLATKLTSYGYSIPLWMGYEDYDPNMRNWIADLMNNNWDDRMDIYGVHYYPNTRKLSALQADLSKIGDIPFWSTEAHWSSKSDQDEIATAEIGMATLWDQTDEGLDGLCMWDFSGNENNLRFNMVKEAMLPLKDAQPIFTDDVDGTSITSDKYGVQLLTRSFIEDSLVTVYATNTSTTTSYDGFVFELNYGTIDGTVSYVQFRDDTAVKGESGTAATHPDHTKFGMSLPARSITKLTFLIDPLDIVKMECEDLTYSSPSATTMQKQSNAMAAGGYHINLAATGVDKSIEFEVNMAEAGEYKMMLTGLTWSSFGQYALQLQDASQNWQTIGGTLDLYNVKSRRNSYTWEGINLDAGINKIRFISTDKATSASSYKGSFDYLVFEKTGVLATGERVSLSALKLHPSLVLNTLNVQGLMPLASYHIYNMSGKRMLTANTPSVDVASFPAGVYILESNGASAKFIKR